MCVVHLLNWIEIDGDKRTHRTVDKGGTSGFFSDAKIRAVTSIGDDRLLFFVCALPCGEIHVVFMQRSTLPEHTANCFRYLLSW
jgi:hypothetical protein